MKLFRIIALIISLSFLFEANAQPQKRLYEIDVYPEKGEWNLPLNQNVNYVVNLTKSNVPYGNFEVSYEISEDMMSPIKEGKVRLHDGRGVIKGGSMKQPGFLRCKVFWENEGRKYEGMATVGYSPETLQPVTQLPSDFNEFWNKAISDARKWDLEPKIIFDAQASTPKVNVYKVSWTNNGWGSKMYGVLTIPAKPGKYPAILKVPGAGVRAYNGDISHSEKGVIILEIGIHGIPVDLPAVVYQNLYQGALKDYYLYNMDHRDRFYYKRVITGCIRAVDFIEQLPEFNGCLATFGGSQGGALSIMVAALDERVKGLVSMYPAMSDMVGYTQNRAGGWPHAMKNPNRHTTETINTLAYYDTTSFARNVSVPGFYTFGYNDLTCPPTTTMSVYNVVEAPKELMVCETTEHYAFQEQQSAAWNWVINFLKQCSE
ncbi:MAG: acetylxylan esterase [Muribaculaceae bacterium]|nr:acetylxylan esterase [Muribaculaceae bacterium]